jgi:hypothetical protein
MNSLRHGGISTVIGGLLFVILMSAGLAVMSIALSYQVSTVETHNYITDKLIKKEQENFKIKATNLNGFLSTSVKNEGPNPVVIKTVWLIGDGTNVHESKRIDVDPAISHIYNDGTYYPVLSLNQQPVSSTYSSVTVKAISELGNVAQTTFENPPPQAGVGVTDQLRANLLLIPSYASAKNGITALLIISNQGSNTLYVDQPILKVYDSSTPPKDTEETNCSYCLTKVSIVNSASTIPPYGFVTYPYHLYITGVSGNNVAKFKAQASITGHNESNDPLTTASQANLCLFGANANSVDPSQCH